jgi:hypothetical protein
LGSARGSTSSVNSAGSRGRRAVDGGRRLHDQLAHARRLLARGQQLHRPDDVDLLHRRPAAGSQRRGDDVHVDDGVDLVLGDDLGDERVADVGAHELGAAELALHVRPRRDGVDADDPLDRGVGLQDARRAGCRGSG